MAEKIGSMFQSAKESIQGAASQAKSQTQEKSNQMAVKAGDMLQSAKESIQGEKTSSVTDKTGGMSQYAKESIEGAGEQIKTTALDATEAAKNATGINK